MDDVVVVVETDKVTVDIKALSSGRITQILANDKVTVGGPLYELDRGESEGNTSTIINANQSSSISSVNDNHHHPLIKFIGKRIKQPVTNSANSPLISMASVSRPSMVVSVPIADPLFMLSKKPSGSAMDFTHLKRGALFGRPELTPKEMAAIESGGADF